MITKLLSIIIVSLLLIGCKDSTTPAQMVGGDTDAQGCIPSAGYTWCEKTKQCERPWELAEQKGFENRNKQFTAFCENQLTTP